MKDEINECFNCLFWVRSGVDKTGDCRFNPPTIVDFFVKQAEVDFKFEDKDSSLQNATSWPVTNEYDWCGKFTAGPSDE